MNTNFCIELSDDAAQDISGGYYFGPSSTTNVNANISENLFINKYFQSITRVFGNLAGGEATATAIGANTATQAISNTQVVQGFGSTSNATSLSATNGGFFFLL
ncbi:hypothetical protein [Chamaesiphon sp.]|uniref:hypothetical protein n=1 Tax=Chamaesiphon sp. TaxID=2814140 RepID=UPI0035938ED0